MNNFLIDFKIFFDAIFDCLSIVFDFFTSNIIGEIIIFTIVIGLFIGFIFTIVHMKD